MESLDQFTRSTSDKSSVQTNPLEQFLALAKKTTGQEAVQLIKQVLEAPSVYVFAELLDEPNILQLKEDPNFLPYYTLLEIFAYGVYSDYTSISKNLPEISMGMKKKLRQLTIATLATFQKSLPVPDIATQLEITSVRELEDLIIEAVYAGIIKGRLDQKNGLLEIEFAVGRDIKPADLLVIANTLQDWCSTCDSMLTEVEQLIEKSNKKKLDHNKHKQDLDIEIGNIKANLRAMLEDAELEPPIEGREGDKKRGSKKGGPYKLWPKHS